MRFILLCNPFSDENSAYFTANSFAAVANRGSLRRVTSREPIRSGRLGSALRPAPMRVDRPAGDHLLDVSRRPVRQAGGGPICGRLHDKMPPHNMGQEHKGVRNLIAIWFLTPLFSPLACSSPRTRARSWSCVSIHSAAIAASRGCVNADRKSTRL